MKKLLFSSIITGTALSVMALAIPFAASAKSPAAYAHVHAQVPAVSVGITASSTLPESCDIPFGHLIAPGWLRKNGQATTTVPAGCILPFGIGMRFHATSTATSTIPFPLRIMNIRSSAASTTANISWHTNAAADSTVYYSTSSPVTIGATSTASTGSTAKVYDHAVTLQGLATSTTYYFLPVSTDASGVTATGTESHLTTSSM